MQYESFLHVVKKQRFYVSFIVDTLLDVHVVKKQRFYVSFIVDTLLDVHVVEHWKYSPSSTMMWHVVKPP